MKKYGEQIQETLPNAWGQDKTVTKQMYIVEPEDIGTCRHHYLGYNHRSHIFTENDVGCAIVVYSDGKGWTNWVFGLNWETDKWKSLH